VLYGVGEVIGFLEVAVISVMFCGHVSCLWSVRLEEMLKMTAKENKTKLGVEEKERGIVLSVLSVLANRAVLTKSSRSIRYVHLSK
jgi:hypothetical protein